MTDLHEAPDLQDTMTAHPRQQRVTTGSVHGLTAATPVLGVTVGSTDGAIGSVADRARSEDPEDLPVLDSLADVVALLPDHDELYLRYSEGPDVDAMTTQWDRESGSSLPGLPALPLVAPAWFASSPRVWVARQICHNVMSTERAWLLTGSVVGRGADNEPLLSPYRPVALLSDLALHEAETLYAAWRLRRFT